MLERDTFAMIFGEPHCGKSFMAIDWAWRIATGTAWRGSDVKPAPAVYVAGEGRRGIAIRSRAWREHHDVTTAGKPFCVSKRAVAIVDPSSLALLFAEIDYELAAAGQPGLIVLDTLARCFGGGDENSTQDMSRFVAACDAIRNRYEGCTLLVVHHSGHGDKSRARGAIALKAALDAEYRLANDGNNGLVLTATKMKDAEQPPPLSMELVKVELPGLADDYGNPVTSCAIEVIDTDVEALISKAASSPGHRGKWKQVGLATARRLIAIGDGQTSVDEWRAECQAVGMVRQNQHRVLEALLSQGDIVASNGQLSLPAA